MITIGDIIEDVNPFTEKGAKVVTLAVVPRQLIIDTIDELENNITILKGAGAPTKHLENIRENTIDRLEAFEEEGRRLYITGGNCPEIITEKSARSEALNEIVHRITIAYANTVKNHEEECIEGLKKAAEIIREYIEEGEGE